ncbi:hypothetical protein JTB14_036880 [Gonioctena quinquepunctata]|nr:hypothetical protein JTB14_036880 [Gonioctena quinquepunctata]
MGEEGLQGNPIVLEFVSFSRKQDLYKNIQNLRGTEELVNLEKEEDDDSKEIIEEQEIPGKHAPQSTTNDGSAIPGRKFAVEKNKRKRSKVNYSPKT